MHGLIVEGLQRYMTARGGTAAWASLTADRDDTFAAPDEGRVFGDEEVAEIFAAAAERFGCSVAELHEDFGRFLAPLFLGVAAPIADDSWTAIDLIEQTEALFHRTVRVSEPGAAPPVLDVRRVGADAVVLLYGSARRMCGIACGIVAGIGEQYGEPLEVEHERCMHDGAAACEIRVTRRR